jgi:alkylhydroperoxidase family enzyme
VHLTAPRIVPTTSSDWDDDSRPIVERTAAFNDGEVMNVIATVARHPKLLKRWTVFGNHILGGSTLPARERELVILRTGFVASSPYEWVQHVKIARQAGCTDEEIERVMSGPDHPDWSDTDRALLEATDELMADRFISDQVWGALRSKWSEQQCMDLVFTVGQYCLVSMALNTFGVQIEDGVERFPSALFTDGPFSDVP